MHFSLLIVSSPMVKRQKLLFKTIQRRGDRENSQALSFSFGTSGELHQRYKENESQKLQPSLSHHDPIRRKFSMSFLDSAHLISREVDCLCSILFIKNAFIINSYGKEKKVFSSGAKGELFKRYRCMLYMEREP